MNVSSTYSMILNAEDESSAPVKVDFVNLKKAAMILRALNHKLRQQIVKLIDENKKLTVTEIYIKLRLEQSVERIKRSQFRPAPYGSAGTIRNANGAFRMRNQSHPRTRNLSYQALPE